VSDANLVLDTDVVVAAMRSPSGASAAILRSIRTGRATLLLTVALAIEYEAILLHPEHRLAAGLNQKQAEIFGDALVAMAEPVESHFLWRPLLRDPNDEMVLETAVSGQADALVTFNRRDYGASAGLFGIELLLPREIIQRMKR
jgi:putative PIN family toxin of toxin-antitoxin system